MLTPHYAPDEHAYQAGLWVKDSTAGIGTVTYYEAGTGNFAGLGIRSAHGKQVTAPAFERRKRRPFSIGSVSRDSPALRGAAGVLHLPQGRQAVCCQYPAVCSGCNG